MNSDDLRVALTRLAEGLEMSFECKKYAEDTFSVLGLGN